MDNVLNWQECRDEKIAMGTAVMQELNAKFKVTCLGVRAGWTTQEDIDRERGLAQEYRAWLTMQDDEAVVRSYNRWLDFFEGTLEQAQNALNDR
jgi:hypothetical protein